MPRTFTREQFHDLVWSKPLTHLAKEFALSDVALHKICKKHGIPNPPLGWWAKKAAGKAVKQTPLPKTRDGGADRITIASGELRAESELIAEAREKARVLASTIEGIDKPFSNPIVDRTIAKLRKEKPAPITGLVAVAQSGLIKVEVAPDSVERLQLILNRIAAAAAVMDIRIIKTERSTAFECDGETIGFSITETTKREKHALTEKEKAEELTHQKKRERYWSKPRSWGDDNFDIFPLRFPEWDYVPTGQLSFELEQFYLSGSSPRRSYRDAKVQRLEKMAVDIAVGIKVLTAARRDDRLRREDDARRREEERLRREIVMRRKHIEERRSEALDTLLKEVADLDRLRRLVSSLRSELDTGQLGRVAGLISFAEETLSRRQDALSAGPLEQRLASDRLFSDDDDYGFRPSSF
ncbi:hypothetical protein [Sphingomonas sp. AX6]|uniref:hypothetical protein n=1 Tax=Sphingomonas sp. AX6 TaxID=2653171 RepID=UPI0012F00321|nr:hypothetical protein [Sphingomonas sp. AX6]VXC84539.1 conserved hypothetical protein [Sphingomonas sp. AX6]